MTRDESQVISSLHESQDPLEKALASTDVTLKPIGEDEKPLAVFSSPALFVARLVAWVFALLTAMLVAREVLRGDLWLLWLMTPFAPLLVILHLLKPKPFLEVYPDRLRWRMKRGKIVEAPLQGAVICLRFPGKGGDSTMLAEPKGFEKLELGDAADPDGGRSWRFLFLMKELGVKLDLPGWRDEGPLSEDEATMISAAQILPSKPEIVSSSLIGLLVILALGAWGLLAPALAIWVSLALGLAAAVMWRSAIGLRRKLDKRLSGIHFGVDGLVCYRKGEVLWEARRSEIKRFVASPGRLGPTFTLVTHYGRRLPLMRASRSDLLRQVFGRGYELVWEEKGADEGRFLP